MGEQKCRGSGRESTGEWFGLVAALGVGGGCEKFFY